MSSLMTNIAEAFTRLFRQNHRCIVSLTDICQLQLDRLLDKIQVRTTSAIANTINGTFSIPSGVTGQSDAILSEGYNVLGIVGSSTNIHDNIFIYVSIDDNTYYPAIEVDSSVGSGGRIYVEITNPAFKYYKIFQTHSHGGGADDTLVYTISQR